MPDLKDGESVEIKGSAAKPYIIRNIGGLYSCTCPAWRNQSVGIEQRTCKHIRKLRGDAAETERIGSALPARPVATEGDDAASGPGLLLAQTWTNDVDLAGWWMSEKLDGVRALWDGKQFLSRQGNLFHAPDWFVEQLPKTPLDGELWLARKSFQRTVSIVRRQDKSDLWREISFVVFDAPAIDDVFERRQAAIADTLGASATKFARRLEQQLCRDTDHLREELARVEQLGGEGLMLRQPQSRYEAGRSSTLYKVKTFHDAEAHVVDHLPGAGRHQGRLGALLVELPNGTQFNVGTGFSDAQRESPPAVGAQITFRYQELSDRGVPRFPSFVRQRSDAAEAETKAAATSQKSKAAKSAKSSTTKTPADASPTVAAVTSTTESSTPTSTNNTRRFEYHDATSAKFWQITITALDVTVNYGRIGTNGQSQTKSFADSTAAQKHADKLIAEKTGKGYVEASPS